MDIFAFVAVSFLVLLGALAMAAMTMQQNGQLREIQAKLSKMSKSERPKLDPETLRIDRAGIMDPLVLLEVSLGQPGGEEITEEQLQQIDAARTSVKSISAQLKSAGEWMGPPYDLEWVELLDRMPRLKANYQKAGLSPD